MTDLIKEKLKEFRSNVVDGDLTQNFSRDARSNNYYKGLYCDSRSHRVKALYKLLENAKESITYDLYVKDYCREHHQKQPALCVKEEQLRTTQTLLSKLMYQLEQMNLTEKD